MIGEHEEQTARQLAAALQAELACDINTEGGGVHWLVRASHEDRSASVACFWYAPPDPSTVTFGLAGSKAHVGRTSAGTDYVARASAEYLVAFQVNDLRIAGGRTRVATDIAACLRAWLLERREISELYGPWPFVDATRRELRRLAALIEPALARPGPARVVLERDIGYDLWVYGNDRSCNLRLGTPVRCAFLIGQNQVAAAAVPESQLAEVMAAWTQARVSLADLAGRTPGLTVLPHAELLERGEAAQWHWANVLDDARAGSFPLDSFLPLFERIVARPAINRFYSFTSMHWLCLSYSSNYPFVRDGLPVLHTAGGERFTLRQGHETWTDRPDGILERLEQILDRTTRAPFRGSSTDVDIRTVDAELARQGSPLRARSVQRRQWFEIQVAANDRTCQVSPDSGWGVTYHDATGERGRQDYADGAAAIEAVRRWLEKTGDVEFTPARLMLALD